MAVMLYAVRHAIAHLERSEDAHLAIAEKKLRDANELLIGAVENGPWALIPDPRLRQMVGLRRRYLPLGGLGRRVR